MSTLERLSSDTKEVLGKLKDREIPEEDVENLKLMSEIGLTTFAPFQLKCNIAEELGFKKFDLSELAEMLTGHRLKNLKTNEYWYDLDWVEDGKDARRIIGLTFKANGEDYTVGPLNYLKSKMPRSVMASIAECKENKIFHTVLGMAPTVLWSVPANIDPLVMGVIFENPSIETQNVMPGRNNAAFYFLAKWPD